MIVTETGFQQLKTIYKALEHSSMTGVFKEPYAVVRKQKGGSGRDNIRPNKRASRCLSSLDRECADLAWRYAEESDNVMKLERNCDSCGVEYIPRERDIGLCRVCILRP